MTSYIFSKLKHVNICFFYRDDVPSCDVVLDVATLLRNHISSAVSFTKSVVLIVRIQTMEKLCKRDDATKS